MISLMWRTFYHLRIVDRYNIAAALLRALGDSKATLYFLLVSSILNVVLDLAFVAGLGLGVAGAAVATVISQIASCVIGAQSRSRGVGFGGGYVRSKRVGDDCGFGSGIS